MINTDLIIQANELTPQQKVSIYLEHIEDATPEEFDAFLVRLATWEWLIKPKQNDSKRDKTTQRVARKAK